MRSIIITAKIKYYLEKKANLFCLGALAETLPRRAVVNPGRRNICKGTDEKVIVCSLNGLNGVCVCFSATEHFFHLNLSLNLNV